MKELVMIDTFTGNDEDYDYLKEDTTQLIKAAVTVYEKRYHTSVGGFLQLAERSSQYGSIGGAGLTGGRYKDNLDDLFYSEDATDLRVYLDNGGLHFDFYDHDGCNATVLKFITDSTLEAQDTAHDEHGFTYDQTIDYLLEKKHYTKGTDYRIFEKGCRESV